MDDIITPTRAPKTPLSTLHDILGKVRREKHAANLNRLLNDPSVYPWVHGATIGPIDMSGSLQDPDVILLMGQHGGILYHRRQTGIFEIHCQCYPEGRGAWMLSFARACLHWIFTRTECVEVMTRCPEGNLAARSLARAAGMQRHFTNPMGWTMKGKRVPADIYSIGIQQWMATAPGLAERGEWFCGALAEQCRRHGVDAAPIADPAFHRYIGAAFEMFAVGEFHKGCIFFNRYAALSDFTPIVIISAQPMTIAIGGSVAVFREGGEFYVATHLNQSDTVN